MIGKAKASHNSIFNRNRHYAISPSAITALIFTGVPIGLLILAGIVSLIVFAVRKILKKSNGEEESIQQNNQQNLNQQNNQIYNNQTVQLQPNNIQPKTTVNTTNNNQNQQNINNNYNKKLKKIKSSNNPNINLNYNLNERNNTI